MSSAVCRVCLVGEVKMHSVGDIHLLEVYEKLTNARLNSYDGRPHTLCFICRSQLTKCRDFTNMALRSENILHELLLNGIQVSHSTISHMVVTQGSRLSKGDVKFISTEKDFDDTNQYLSLQHKKVKTVKKEPLIEINIKGMPSEETAAKTEDDIKTEMSHNESEIDRFEDDISLEDIKPSETGQQTCHICKKQFANLNILIKHLAIHIETSEKKMIRKEKDKKELYCSSCNKKFTQKGNLQRHIESRHKSVPLEHLHKCKVCSKRFSTNRFLARHMKVHTNPSALATSKGKRKKSCVLNKQFPCDKCGKRFTDERNVRAHIKKIHKEKSYKCDVCNKAFLYRRSLVIHRAIHKKEAPKFPYTCDICGKSFNNTYIFERHKNAHIEKPKKSIVCDICGKEFGLAYFKSHLLTHTEHKKYSCSDCQKTFTFKTALKRHIFRVHTLYKPESYQCEICLKTFTESCKRWKHMQSHTAERKFACSKCNKTFYRKDHWKQHMKSIACNSMPIAGMQPNLNVN